MNGIEAPNVNELAYARGVFGYGPGVVNDGGSARWAGHGSNGARINALGQRVEDQADCTRGIIGQQFSTISGQFENATRDRQISSLQDAIFQSELRLRNIIDTNDRENARRTEALREQQHKAEVEAAKEFGAIKAQNAAIDAKIDSNQKFNELFTENQALKTQVACGCTTGCSQPC